MRNKTIISAIISGLSLTLALLILTISLVMNELSAKKLELDNVYENGFYSFCDSVNNLETDLGKLTVASDTVESIGVINDAHTHAQSAIDSFSILPLDFTNEQTCIKFLNQVCDWSDSYAKSVAQNKTQDYKQSAEKLYECVRELNGKLKEIASRTNGNKFARLNSNQLIAKNAVDLSLSMRSLNIEYPTLIYDGPFSDREEFVAKALENKRRISESEAEKIASTALGMQEIKMLGKSDNKVEVYELSGKIDGSQAYACITQKGGYVSLFLCNCDSESDVYLSESDAEKIAKSKLESLGYYNMSPVWKNNNDGHMYFNFAPLVDDVVYYPDIVKVRISLASGKIEGVEASGFVSSYTQRQYKARLSKADAVKNVNLSDKSVRLAVIPLDKGERFCYEVYGTHNGEKYYVYVDAITGEQVEVLKVIGTDQGEVVM